MAQNPKHIIAPAKPQASKPLTEEEKAQQIARFFAQKREALFQLILANTIQGKYDIDLRAAVDKALEAADYALEKMFPLPKAEEEKA